MRVGVYIHGGVGNVVMQSSLLRALEILGYEVSLLMSSQKESSLLEEVSWLPIRYLDAASTVTELSAHYECGFFFDHPGSAPGYIRHLFYQAPHWHMFSHLSWDLTSPHEVEYYMQAARMLGWVGPPPHPYIREAHSSSIEEYPKHIGLAIGAHLGRDWVKKMWPWQSWAKLAHILNKKGYEVALYGGGEGDRWQAHQIEQEVDLLTSFLDVPLSELAPVLRDSCTLLIGNDTGLLHIGAALQVPILGVFGPTLLNKNIPIGDTSMVMLTSDLKCVPCFGSDLWGACSGGCMQQILPEQVVSTIEEMPLVSPSFL